MAVIRTDVVTHPEFALESMDVEDGHVVVQGRWFGVIGRRFVRPALRIDGQRRVIATLEHKPWAASEGELWVAAFPYAGDAIATATLEVAPDVNVDLSTGQSVTAAVIDKRKASAAKATQRRTKPKRDDLVEALRKAEREREDLRSRLDHVLGLRDEAIEERDEAIGARDAALEDADNRERRVLDRARAEVDRVRGEAESARKEYDDTYRRAVRADQAAEEARAELAALQTMRAAEDHGQHAEVERARDAAIAESGRLLGERDAARAEARRQRDERDTARAEADRLRRQHERARADRAQPTPSTPARERDTLVRAAASPEPTVEQPVVRRDPDPTVELPPDHVSRAPGLAPRLRSRFDLPTDPDEDSDLGPRIVAAALIILMMVAFVLVLGMIF